MDTESLVDREIDQGRRLVQALDQKGFPVVAALWSFLPEEGGWRLLIASPKVNEVGPRAAYAAIQDALLESHIDLPLYRISAVTPTEALVGELRIFAGTDPAPFLGSTYLQKAVIGDAYVEGAYVYRAERIIGTNGTFAFWSVAFNRPRKVWTAQRCKVTVEGGFFKKIDVEGTDWPQSHRGAGIDAYLEVLANPQVQDGEILGDVERWTIRAGRLRSVETVARGARVEGFVGSTPSSAAT